MNYRQVEIFRSVMEHGSITRAAESLFVTQPAISKAIKQLEEEIGFSLFLRTGQGMLPSQEARAFFTETERAHFAMTHLERFVRNLNRIGHGRLVISTIHALSVGWLAPLVSEFSRTIPDASISVRAYTSIQTMQFVGQGDVDVGISQAPIADPMVQRRRLFDLQALIALPEGHRLASRSAITASDLDGEPMVSLSPSDHLQRSLEARMTAEGLAISSKADVAMGSMMCALVESGTGVGLVDSETARMESDRRMVFRPVSPPIRIPIYLLQNTQRAPDMLLRKFIELVAHRPPKRFP